MNEDDKQYVANWLVNSLVKDGEMPQIRVQRKIFYTEAVSIPADIAIQGKKVIDEYIYKHSGPYYRTLNWENLGDYDEDIVYSLFDDYNGDYLADVE